MACPALDRCCMHMSKFVADAVDTRTYPSIIWHACIHTSMHMRMLCTCTYGNHAHAQLMHSHEFELIWFCEVKLSSDLRSSKNNAL